MIIKSNQSRILSAKSTAPVLPIETVNFVPGKRAIPAVEALHLDGVMIQDAKQAQDAVEMVRPVAGRAFVPGYSEITIQCENLAVTVETIARMRLEGYVMPVDEYIVPAVAGAFTIMYRIPKVTNDDVKDFRDAVKRTKSADGHNKPALDALAAEKAAEAAKRKAAAAAKKAEGEMTPDEKEALKVKKAEERAAKKAAKKAEADEKKRIEEEAKANMTDEEKAAIRATAAAKAAETRARKEREAAELMAAGNYDTTFIPGKIDASQVEVSEEVAPVLVSQEEMETMVEDTPEAVDPTGADTEEVEVEEWPGSDAL